MKRSAGWWCHSATATLLFASACSQPPGTLAARPAASAQPDAGPPGIRQFDADIFDGSGVVQLPDGRLLIAEDDERNPLAIVDLFGTKKPRYFAPKELKRALSAWATNGLNDLEALTMDPRGHLYASTSHSLTTKGVSKQEREQLVRFDVAGSRLSDLHVYLRLKQALATIDPIFAAVAQTADANGRGGLNIEGLAWDPDHARLLIGFRSPRRAGDALVVWLQNPDDLFERGAAPSLTPPMELDLDGEGNRDATFSPTLHGFLIVAGAWRHNKHAPPTLWFWRGGAERAVKLRASGFEDLNPEGIADVVTSTGRRLLMVSDDGSGDALYYRGRAVENQGNRGRYIVLSFDQLIRDNGFLK